MIGARMIETIHSATKSTPSAAAVAVASPAAAPPQAPPAPVRQQEDRAGQRGHHGHQPHVVVPDVGHLVADHALELVPVEGVEQPAGDRDRGLAGPGPGREGVRDRSRARSQIDGLRQPARDRDLLDDVVEESLLRVGRIERDRVRGFEDGAVAAVERPPRRQAADAERPERRDRDSRREAAGVEQAVGAEPHQGEEDDEPRDEEPRVGEVALLLIVEVHRSQGRRRAGRGVRTASGPSGRSSPPSARRARRRP